MCPFLIEPQLMRKLSKSSAKPNKCVVLINMNRHADVFALSSLSTFTDAMCVLQVLPP